ncbi:MAG: FAD:protein FMN transferase [Bacteroidaceae bacterium]|nr:FAD:protein FMN transferase [Bacteroidaceae bacterium]
MKRWQIIFLLFLVAGTAYILTGNVPYQKEEGNIFGTTYRITYKSKKSYKEEIKNTLQQVDNSLSPFNKSSIISKINNNEDATPDSMFLYVINMAQQVSQATDGAFDITVAPLVNAWGFGFKKGIEPDSATIEEMLSYTGYNKISLADGKIKKEHPQTMLNCSAIAKGYGCDAVARMLRSKGIDNYMVEIGGEVALKGVNSKDNRWTIGVNKPIEDAKQTNELQTILRLTDCSMATSGNYRNYRYIDGKKYSHTIDPHSGYPVEHSLLSATVIAKECAYADALATAFMVMGVEKAMQFCEQHPEVEAYFIYADETGKMLTRETTGFKKYKK